MLVDSAPDVRVRLLGGVELQVDARDVPVTSRLQRAILAVLALNAGHVVSSARLIDALWGEQAPDTVTTALQVHVSGLRKVLGPASKAVVTRSPGYLLAIPADHVDVLALKDALRVARKGAPAAQWPSVTFDAVPLADLAGLPFVAAAAAHIEELRWASAEERSEAELAAGGHADLVPRLQDMVAAQPYREGLWRSLMVALYRCGRQSDALAAFRQVTKVLRDDLGLDPGPALVAVQRAVLAADPILLAS